MIEECLTSCFLFQKEKGLLSSCCLDQLLNEVASRKRRGSFSSSNSRENIRRAFLDQTKEGSSSPASCYQMLPRSHTTTPQSQQLSATVAPSSNSYSQTNHLRTWEETPISEYGNPQLAVDGFPLHWPDYWGLGKDEFKYWLLDEDLWTTGNGHETFPGQEILGATTKKATDLITCHYIRLAKLIIYSRVSSVRLASMAKGIWLFSRLPVLYLYPPGSLR